MTPTASALDRYAALFEAREADRAAEPERLRAVRREAFERFAARGFPATTWEDWRYTSVAPIEKAAFGAASGPALAVEAPSVAGLEIARRLEAVEIHRQAAGRTPFADLNAALFDDLVVVEVAAGARIPLPIRVRHRAAAGVAHHPRLLIVIGDGAEATVVETHDGPAGARYWTNAVAEVIVGARATLTRIRVQREAAEAFHTAADEWRVGAGARVLSLAFTFGGAIARHDIHAVLAGEGVDADLNGLFVGGARQHLDTSLLVEHAAPRCESREVYKGIMSGRATGVFQGRIHVHPGAQKTDAKQTNRNLLLSPEASVTTKPQLEIYADDVKCTHGATTGRLDADALFYLRSRGVDEGEARNLLTRAFALEITAQIGLEDLRGSVEESLRAALPASAGGGR